MSATRHQYTYVPGPDPHLARTRSILDAHPEARALLGPTRWSAVVGLSLNAVQLLLAYLLRDAPVPLVLLLAYFVGAFISFACFVMIHEAAHGLIFHSKRANRLIAYLINSSIIVPIAERFIVGHSQHHSHIGEYDKDLGLPRYAESKWVGHSAARKMLWLLAHPFIYARRVTALLHDRPSPPAWLGLNWAIQIGFSAAVITTLGPTAFLYLLSAWYFSAGPHPVAIRLLQEHEILREGQQTNSYYGPFNRLVFNLGYHNEHHDLPSVPWLRLPALTRMAPELYSGLAQSGSWLGTFVGFLFDGRRSLWDRTYRERATPPMGDAPASPG